MRPLNGERAMTREERNARRRELDRNPFHLALSHKVRKAWRDSKSCSVARKEPCRKLTAFIEEVHMGCYGFKRLGRIRIEKDNFKPMPIDKWLKSKGGRMCARAIRGIKMEDIR